MSLSPEIQQFLEEPRFTVLGTLKSDGSIQQTVMWYELRGNMIMMNTAVGRYKERNVRRDPRVSLCWEDGYRYLTIEGTVTEVFLDQEVAKADIFALAYRYHPDATAEDIDRQFSNFREEERMTIMVQIDKVHANGF